MGSHSFRHRWSERDGGGGLTRLNVAEVDIMR
jgi:hypothetical protein